MFRHREGGIVPQWMKLLEIADFRLPIANFNP